MKTTLLIIEMLISIMAGCNAPPPPAPGLATLRVTVTAEPKTGVITGNTHVMSYDSAKSPASENGGAFEHVGYVSLDNVVVWIEPGSSAVDAKPVQVDVTASKPPESLAAAVGSGQSITLHNSGSTPINLYSVSDGNEFDLGTVRSGASSSFTAKSPGLIEVLTDGSKDPVALIYVAPSSRVRLTHAGDTLDFPNLPPGKYEINSWHPRLPGRRIAVTLQPNQITDSSIKVGVNELPKIDNP